MNNQFLPYEMSVKLKELGFTSYHDFCVYSKSKGNALVYSIYDALKNGVPAPLWQQAFDFFRENGIDSSINRVYDCYNISITKWDEVHNKNIDLSEGLRFKDFKKYEDAKLECLDKLIEVYKATEK